MRLLTVLCGALVIVLGCQSAQAADGEARDLEGRVERIVAELADLQAATRDKADLKLRNLPLSAYPMVTRLYAKEKESLPTEAQQRIESSIEMFKALAAIEQRERKYSDWLHANSLKAYDTSSNRSPKWDQPAREAIDLMTTWPRTAAQDERLRASFARANEAGCEDPLFIAYYAIFYGEQGGADERSQLDLYLEALKGVTKRFPYPAWVKCFVACRTKSLMLKRPDLQVDHSTLLPGSADPFTWFAHIRPEDDLPDELLFKMADVISRQQGLIAARYWKERLAKPFARCAADPVYLQLLNGLCDGRDAQRNDDLGDLTPAQAQQQRQDRLKAAQAELEKAYKMDPGLPRIPTEILRLLFLRMADREEIDKWFKRALEINPDDYSACSMMLHNLAAEEKMEFARNCMATRNWRGRLTFILVDAHMLMANLVEDKSEYYKRPEVWEDLQKVYQTQLEFHPDAVRDRSWYALLANRCGQWAEADRQFKILGDLPSLKVFGSITSYNYERRKAARNVAPAQPSTGK